MANGWHDESGVVGSFTQSMNFVRVQNKTLPVAAFRAEEMQEFTVNAVDMKADTVALALHGDATKRHGCTWLCGNRRAAQPRQPDSRL